jgi:hypothetical protein
MRVLLYRILGTIFLGLGILGAFLPLMPTTIFLIMAAYFYARSSQRLYLWLVNHKMLGPLIRNWEEQRAMPRWAKGVSMTLTIVGVGLAITLVTSMVVKALLAALAATILVVLMRIPTY